MIKVVISLEFIFLLVWVTQLGINCLVEDILLHKLRTDRRTRYADMAATSVRTSCLLLVKHSANIRR